MGAPEGNQFWKLRAKSGASRKYENAEDLWADCEKYFEERSQAKWNDQPLPFLLSGLCNYLGITTQTWSDWRKNREDLSGVITRVDQICYDQKLAGAMVGAYQHNIVARELGLADKRDVSLAIPHEERLDALKNKLSKSQKRE